MRACVIRLESCRTCEGTVAGHLRSPQSSSRTRIGQILISVTSAAAYVDQSRRLTDVGTRVDRAGKVLASSSRIAERVPLPDGRGVDVKLAGRDYRTTSFIGDEPTGAGTRVRRASF